jgi:peptide/nickel transport system substrate-binding protein
MRDNIFKYIFFVIIICLLGVASFIIFNDKKNNNTKIINNKIEKDISKDIIIGIAKFDTINPLLTKNYDIQYLDKLVFNSLMDITKDFKLKNDLARECSKINDKLYIIKLNQGIKWHDNTDFTAKDVKFTIDNLKNINSIYSDNVKNIKNVEIIDDYTIKIYLNCETEFFEYMLTFPILNKNSYNDNLESKTKIPIGTGNYKIINMQNDEINLKNNNSKISIKIYSEIKDLYMKFSKEEIDLFTTNNIDYENYTGSIGINSNGVSNRDFDYIAINNENNILKNNKVRKAINYFIDKRKIVYSIFNNKYTMLNFPLNNESYLYNESIFDNYDINAGEKLLLEDGWNLNNGVWEKKNVKLEFNLIVNKNNEKRCLVANEIKKELEKSGIILDITETSDIYYNQAMKNKNYDMILTGNIISISPSISTYFSKGNICNYENQDIIDAMNNIKNISDLEIIKEKYNKIEQIYNDDMPFISLYINNNYILYSSKLKGDFSHNWYNLYYNIDNWYKIK